MGGYRRLAVALLACLFTTVVAQPAGAHSSLIGSDPPAGATLTEAFDEVVLQFDNPIEESFGGLQVFSPDGVRVESGQPVISETAVRVPLDRLRASGIYTVVFRIISADGHPVESDFTFTFDAPTPTPQPTQPTPVPTSEPSPTEPTETPTPLATPTPEASATPPAAVADEPPTDSFQLKDAGAGTALGLWTARFINQLLLTALVGLLVTAVLLHPQSLREGPARGLLRWAGGAAVLWSLSALLLFTFGVSTAAARPLPEALDGDLVRRFASTRFGTSTLVQSAVAILVAAAATTARGRRGAGAALAGAALGAFAPVWWGHAGSSKLLPVAVTSNWAHVLGVTAWVGGLAVLAVVVLSNRGHRLDRAAATRRFSRLAGCAIGAVMLSGLVNALLNMGSADQLLDTTWGRLVVVKLALFAGIAWLGWQNRRRFVPRLSASPEASDVRQAFRRFAAVEVGLMVAAFAVAATLATVVPAQAEAAARIQSIVSPFGDGEINLTVDPAEAGSNLIHLYFLGDDGTPREVDEPELTLTGETGQIAVDLLPAGPGHYTALAQTIPEPGDYTVDVTARIDQRSFQASGAITVR